MIDLYEDLVSHYSSDLKPKLPTCTEGLPKFLNNYHCQVENFLVCVSAIHSKDLEGTLTAVDNKVKYYGATDLPWYFKLIAIYIGQMNEFRKNYKETWEALKKTVTKYLSTYL